MIDPKTYFSGTSEYFLGREQKYALSAGYANKRLYAQKGYYRVAEQLKELVIIEGSAVVQHPRYTRLVDLMERYEALAARYGRSLISGKLIKFADKGILKPLDISLGIKEVYTASRSQKLKTALEVTGGFVGAHYGGEMAALVAVPLTIESGGVGIVAGVGMVSGGIATGAAAGKIVGDRIYNELMKYAPPLAEIGNEIINEAIYITNKIRN